MAAERDSEIDWESELRLSQVDVDDAEDFQLSEVQKEFRFAPPVAVSIVDEYQRSRAITQDTQERYVTFVIHFENLKI